MRNNKFYKSVTNSVSSQETMASITTYNPYLLFGYIYRERTEKSFLHSFMSFLYDSPSSAVRTAQFNTILNEPPIIIIQMRVNTCLPESVPRVIPHLEIRITDTSFIQNNIKSGSPGMCSNIRPESAYAYTVLQSNTSPIFHKEQFYILNITSSI